MAALLLMDCRSDSCYSKSLSRRQECCVFVFPRCDDARILHEKLLKGYSKRLGVLLLVAQRT